MKNKKLIFIELNELNFDYVKYYIKKYKLQNFKRLQSFKKSKTYSEKEYKLLEPWIQWVSIHTGLSAKDHKVFRLGDIYKLKKKQIFETLENKGVSIGVVGAMNSMNLLRKPKYFIPDPWTKTKSDNLPLSRTITKILSLTVKENANLKLNLQTIFEILYIFFTVTRIKKYPYFLYLFAASLNKKWFKAIFLDNLINEIHLYYINKFKPEFSCVFFNAAAHIQHHYFLSSEKNKNKNKLLIPEWYIKKKHDPLKDIVKSYDKMLQSYFEQLQSNYQIILATGLTQIPIKKPIFYWKIKNYEKFLNFFNIKFREIRQLMSRDFVIYFDKQIDLANAYNILKKIYVISKTNLKKERAFKILEKRSDNIFVSLTFPNNTNLDSFFMYKKKKINFNENTDFVAIKNGIHFSKGYFFTTIKSLKLKNKFNIVEIYKIINNYFKHEKKI